MTARTPPWKKKAPAGTKRQPLSENAKARARAAAKKAGRPYPNLIDNMNAARAEKKRAAKKAKKAKKATTAGARATARRP